MIPSNLMRIAPTIPLLQRKYGERYGTVNLNLQSMSSTIETKFIWKVGAFTVP